MSSAKTQIAVAPNVSTLAASQIQKEYSTDEPLNRQNSVGNNRRGNMKGKHLTRSHAMRESTSPPRTPTPRNDQQLSSPNGQNTTANYNSNQQSHHHHHHQQHQQQHHDLNENSNSSHNSNNNNNKLHAQSSASTTATSPLLETPSVIVTGQHSQQQQKQNVVICNEADFPKLSPPKSSKSPRNNNNNNNNTNNNNHRDVGEKTNNSSVGGGGGGGGDNSNKMEYNNVGGGGNSNGKKMISDNNNKLHGNSNINSSNTHNNNNSSNAGGCTGGNNNKTQSYSSTSGANAMQMALNVADSSIKQQQQQQQQQQSTATSTKSTTTNIYNSSMNYQLKPDTGGVGGGMSQQHQSPQNCSGSNSSGNMYDKENRCPRNDSQNSSNNSMSHDESQNNMSENHYDRGGASGGNGSAMMGGGGGGGKKHRTASNSKGTKPRLKNMGSSSSMDGGNSNSTSGFISRDSSMEQFTDQSGIDLLTFFKETLNKNPIDRNTLMKIEKDLVELAQDKNRSEIRFPATSSYNRMLIHRTAAFFGMEHNVDAETQQCVIVAVKKGTRIPEIRFKTLFRDRMSDEPRKSILKRDTHSFDDARQGSYLCPDRGMLDRKAKSFEEREEDYEKARRRIFRNQQQQQQHQQQQHQADNGGGGGGIDCDENYLSWSSSVEQQQQQQQQQSRMRPSGKMLKVQTSNESRDGRPVGVSKANSFGSYGVPPQSGGPPLMRGDSNKSSGSRVFAKQDSMGSTSTPWRLSPSSSGYKTQTQSVHSDSVTPSPTGYGSDDHTPEPSVISCQSPPPPQPLPPPTQPMQVSPSQVLQPPSETVNVGAPAAVAAAAAPSSLCAATSSESAASPSSSSCGLVWAVTDISSVPKGSVLINPHTLQPIVNQDGSIYHFDPTNLPPSQAMNSGMFNQSNATNHGNYSQQQQQQQTNLKKPRQQPQQQQQQPQQHQHKTSQIDYTASPTASIKNSVETCSESSTQTVDVTATQSDLRDTTPTPREMVHIQEEDSNDAEEDCENTGGGASCLSVTTTTSTKSYDRIEIQKFKNQATSPNIPTSPAEVEEASALPDTSTSRDQPSRNQYQSQTPSSTMQQQRDTPTSARSTPYSNADSNAKRTNEESKASPWTYTQSYQAPDGSTVFHTTNGSPYCTTTYQQGPDGSVYAIPQSMVYAYPPQMDGEVQGYFMPVFDPAHQRPEATGIIPAGTQTLYSTTGGATAVLPVATAYPSAQFATTAGTPIYPGQVLYSSEQFPGSGAAVPGTATAANATGPLQQYPVTTYPIGYPYPYNGYWGQTMTTYYVPQQTLANAVTATPLLPAPPPSQPTVGSAVAGSHLASGMSGASLTNNLMVASAAAGPASQVLPNSSHNTANSSGSYQGGVIYNGAIAGRGKSHQNSGIIGGPNAQSATQQNHHHTVSASGITTTYQLGHAVPTFALATTANAPTASDLNGAGSGAAPGTTAMYAIPQHATMFPANILPYATSASQATSGGMLAPVVPHHAHHTASSTVQGAAAHSHQSNTVISPLFSHPPQVFAQPSGATTHAPGPSAIAIVDPATVSHASGSTQQQSSAANSGANTYIGNITPQSAPSTPHSLPTQHQHQRNPPLFATPPISTASGSGGVSYHYYAASNDTPSYSTINHSSAHSYAPTSYEKRHNSANAGKKSTYSNNNSNNISNSYTTAQRGQSYGGGGAGPNKSLLSSSNEMRSSPSSSVSISSNYQGNRPHAMNKRSNDKPTSASLLNGPPVASYASTSNTAPASEQQYNKPARMNSIGGSGGGYRHKPNSFDFRRSASQRNSPSTNSSNESNNNSPSSIVSSPPSTSTYSTSYVTSAGIVSGDQQQQQHQQPASSLYITRGPHIPPNMAPHGAAGITAAGAMAAPPPGSHQATTAAVLGGAAAAAAAAEVANAAAAAAAVATGHQPLLGTYNPGAPTTGVYIKYGQTYFAHPTVALPNSRRSPQSDLRPPMAPMPGMYPAVNMMLSAPTRPVQQRHPNPNYKGTRPSR